jgi:hypothetical protein
VKVFTGGMHSGTWSEPAGNQGAAAFAGLVVIAEVCGMFAGQQNR